MKIFNFILLFSFPYILFANFLDDFNQTWVNEFGAKGYFDGYYIRGEYDSPRASVINSNGDMIIVGQTEGNLSGETTAQQYCGFVSKINSDSIREWTNQCTIDGYQYGSVVDVALDRYDNIFMLGLGSNGSFVAKTNSNGNILWYKNFDIANGSLDIYALHVSKDGIAYATGVYSPNDYNQASSLFIVKFSEDGVSYDIHQFGSFTNGDTRPADIAEDSQGNIYISGYTNSNTFDGETNSGSNDIFLTKFDISGNRQWSKLFGSKTAPSNQLKSELARAMYIDKNDNIYIAGDTSGNLGGQINSGNYDMFVSKFSTDGDNLSTFLVGAKNLSNPQYGAAEHVGDITIDKNGNIYLFGSTSGQFLGEDTNGGGYDQLALVKLDTNGTYLWAKQFGKCCPNHDDAGVSISQDEKGNLYLLSRVSQYLGKYYNSRFPDIASIKLTALGDMHFSLFSSKELNSTSKLYDSAKYEDSVTVVGVGYSSSNTTVDYLNLDNNFSQLPQSATNDSKQLPTSIHAITTDPSGNRYIIGSFYVSGDFDEVAVSKYSLNGELIWTKHFRANGGMAMPTSIVYGNNNIYICGYTEGNIDNNSNNSGDGAHRIDGFVISLSSVDGSEKWIKQFSNNSMPVWIRDIGIDINENIHIVGMSGGIATGSIIITSYKKDGTFIGSGMYGSNITNEGMGLAVDGTYLYITATTFGRFSNNINSYGNSDMVLVKIDMSDIENAKLLWSHQIGTPDYDSAYDIDIDNSGNLFVVGYTKGDLYGSNSGDTDMVLQYFSNNGVLLASKQVGTNTKDIAYSVKADSNGGIVVAGLSKEHGVVQYYKLEDSIVTQSSNKVLSLLDGWNLIGANLNLNTLPNSIKIVWQYYNSKWYAFSPIEEIKTKILDADNIYLLNDIKADRGTWILSTTNQNIEQYSDNSVNVKTEFNSGWTLAGTDSYLPVNSITCNNAELQNIWKYRDGIWKLYTNRVNNSGYVSFDKIDNNEGYWVYCN